MSSIEFGPNLSSKLINCAFYYALQVSLIFILIDLFSQSRTVSSSRARPVSPSSCGSVASTLCLALSTQWMNDFTCEGQLLERVVFTLTICSYLVGFVHKCVPINCLKIMSLLLGVNNKLRWTIILLETFYFMSDSPS